MSLFIFFCVYILASVIPGRNRKQWALTQNLVCFFFSLTKQVLRAHIMQGDDGWAKMKVIQMRHEIQLFCQKKIYDENFLVFFAWNRIQEMGGGRTFLWWVTQLFTRKKVRKKGGCYNNYTFSRDLTKLLRLTAVGNPASYCFWVCRSWWNMSRAGSWKDRLQDWLRFFTDQAPHVGTHI